MATVLIVDECFRNRQCLAALLGERGHRVFNALSGADGLESIRKETPDLIVADICFPTLDGCRFVRRLRTDFGEFKIPVVFLIPSLQQAEAIALARACGIEIVLTKHSDSETALRVLGDALADARAPQVKDAKKNLECPHRPFAAESPGDINKRAGPVCGICLGLADIFPLKQALEDFCREARAQLCSRSVALGIVNSDRSGLEQICFSGIRDAAASQLARMPPSQGVLGALFVESNTIRLQGLPGDPAAIGLPHAHPPVHSFLAAPIPNGAGAIGWLYFVDKIGRDQFSSDEEKFAALLASQCGQIIANNRLFSGAMNQPAKLEHENGVSRRRMEAAHMESEHLFRSAFEHTQVGMALTSVDHQFVRVNFAFGRLLGYSEQELLALSPRDVLTPDHYAQNIEHCEKLLAGENNAFHLELQFVHKDGHLLWGSNSVSLSRDGNGQPVYFVSQLQDVSERKNLEGQILHAQHRLQQVVASSPAVLFTMPVSERGFIRIG